MYYKVKNAVLTEDVTQEFWLYVWKNPLAFVPKDNNSSVKAYFMQYLRFRIFDIYRASLPKNLFVDVSEVSEKEELWYTHILESIEENELYAFMKEVVDTQSSIKQRVFHLRFQEDDSVDDISGKLGISKRTVYNYYHEVMTELRTKIQTLLSGKDCKEGQEIKGSE